jgi:hypothetical protein
MGVGYNPKIVTDGLVLCLDAANPKSYPGTGSTWFDLSSGKRNYSIGANVSWNSAGYFNFTGGTCTGPASNSFGFASTVEHTIFAFAKVNTTNANDFFRWRATPTVGSDTRAIQTHFPFGSAFYYDVAGCCGTNQRIVSFTVDDDFTTAGNRCYSWRTRTDIFPHRQFFINTQSVVDSGINTTATVNWNLTDSATIGNNWYGDLYQFIVYNRALSDEEIQQNFNAIRGRFGL